MTRRVSDFPLPSNESILSIALSLSKQIEGELHEKRYATARQILALVGTGAFIAASFAFPTLPKALQPFLHKPDEHDVWKRFNIRYLKRTLERLDKQKLISIEDHGGVQSISVTESGKKRILRFALDELSIYKPKNWDGSWRLVCYDIPKKKKKLRAIFREYLCAWGFYPLQESVFLHAYPCLKEVTFLREYLGIGTYVRLFSVSSVENDTEFREYFGI